MNASKAILYFLARDIDRGCLSRGSRKIGSFSDSE